MKSKNFITIVILLTLIGCNRYSLYKSVYLKIYSAEKEFYDDLYKGVDRLSNSIEYNKIDRTFKTLFHKLSKEGSEYYIDPKKEFNIVWDKGGPEYCIWGIVWNNTKIIRFDKCLYGKPNKLKLRLIDSQNVIENSHEFMIYDLVNRWDTNTINKLSWKSITEFYSDTTLINFTDSINTIRNYNLPLGTTDPPAYTAAKVNLINSDIETIIFRFP